MHCVLIIHDILLLMHCVFIIHDIHYVQDVFLDGKGHTYLGCLNSSNMYAIDGILFL